MIDPWLSYFGHPVLPTGYNSWETDGDDVNGSGVNEPVWPQLFDTFVSFEVIFITEEMLEIFETGCPDYVVPCVPDTIVFPRAVDIYTVRKRA